ncbi:MAG TPA: hypothetical protein VHD76_05270 [Bryobacteraceae bacterium]|nr:hypothetical protein [Bryobacteraceae bacterium]
MSARQAARVRTHLEICWKCRARRNEIEATIAGFMRARDGELNSRIPPPAGPRALLKARLAAVARQPQPSRWRILRFEAAMVASAAASLLVAAALVVHYRNVPDPLARPQRALTPGTVRTVAARDVCLSEPSADLREAPKRLQRRVFEEYGMPNARAELYEVDYLITPELGGAADLRNLWPEPYSDTVWNARVKDALEDRLHSMVCAGKLDLATAQREISTDWITAYKKYFRTNRPLGMN